MPSASTPSTSLGIAAQPIAISRTASSVRIVDPYDPSQTPQPLNAHHHSPIPSRPPQHGGGGDGGAAGASSFSRHRSGKQGNTHTAAATATSSGGGDASAPSPSFSVPTVSSSMRFQGTANPDASTRSGAAAGREYYSLFESVSEQIQSRNEALISDVATALNVGSGGGGVSYSSSNGTNPPHPSHNAHNNGAEGPNSAVNTSGASYGGSNNSYTAAFPSLAPLAGPGAAVLRGGGGGNSGLALGQQMLGTSVGNGMVMVRRTASFSSRQRQQTATQQLQQSGLLMGGPPTPIPLGSTPTTYPAGERSQQADANAEEERLRKKKAKRSAASSHRSQRLRRPSKQFSVMTNSDEDEDSMLGGSSGSDTDNYSAGSDCGDGAQTFAPPPALNLSGCAEDGMTKASGGEAAAHHLHQQQQKKRPADLNEFSGSSGCAGLASTRVYSGGALATMSGGSDNEGEDQKGGTTTVQAAHAIVQPPTAVTSSAVVGSPNFAAPEHLSRHEKARLRIAHQAALRQKAKEAQLERTHARMDLVETKRLVAEKLRSSVVAQVWWTVFTVANAAAQIREVIARRKSLNFLAFRLLPRLRIKIHRMRCEREIEIRRNLLDISSSLSSSSGRQPLRRPTLSMLRTDEVLRLFPDSLLLDLIPLMEPRFYYSGDIIFYQGAAGCEAFVISEGEVVYRSTRIGGGGNDGGGVGGGGEQYTAAFSPGLVTPASHVGLDGKSSFTPASLALGIGGAASTGPAAITAPSTPPSLGSLSALPIPSDKRHTLATTTANTSTSTSPTAAAAATGIRQGHGFNLTVSDLNTQAYECAPPATATAAGSTSDDLLLVAGAANSSGGGANPQQLSRIASHDSLYHQQQNMLGSSGGPLQRRPSAIQFVGLRSDDTPSDGVAAISAPDLLGGGGGGGTLSLNTTAIQSNLVSPYIGAIAVQQRSAAAAVTVGSGASPLHPHQHQHSHSSPMTAAGAQRHQSNASLVMYRDVSVPKVLGVGAVFGANGMISGEKRGATFRAVTDLVVWTISRPSFEAAIAASNSKAVLQRAMGVVRASHCANIQKLHNKAFTPDGLQKFEVFSRVDRSILREIGRMCLVRREAPPPTPAQSSSPLLSTVTTAAAADSSEAVGGSALSPSSAAARAALSEEAARNERARQLRLQAEAEAADMPEAMLFQPSEVITRDFSRPANAYVVLGGSVAIEVDVPLSAAGAYSHALFFVLRHFADAVHCARRVNMLYLYDLAATATEEAFAAYTSSNNTAANAGGVATAGTHNANGGAAPTAASSANPPPRTPTTSGAARPARSSGPHPPAAATKGWAPLSSPSSFPNASSQNRKPNTAFTVTIPKVSSPLLVGMSNMVMGNEHGAVRVIAKTSCDAMRLPRQALLRTLTAADFYSFPSVQHYVRRRRLAFFAYWYVRATPLPRSDPLKLVPRRDAQKALMTKMGGGSGGGGIAPSSPQHGASSSPSYPYRRSGGGFGGGGGGGRSNSVVRAMPSLFTPILLANAGASSSQPFGASSSGGALASANGGASAPPPNATANSAARASSPTLRPNAFGSGVNFGAANSAANASASGILPAVPPFLPADPFPNGLDEFIIDGPTNNNADEAVIVLKGVFGAPVGTILSKRAAGDDAAGTQPFLWPPLQQVYYGDYAGCGVRLGGGGGAAGLNVSGGGSPPASSDAAVNTSSGVFGGGQHSPNTSASLLGSGSSAPVTVLRVRRRDIHRAIAAELDEENRNAFLANIKVCATYENGGTEPQNAPFVPPSGAAAGHNSHHHHHGNHHLSNSDAKPSGPAANSARSAGGQPSLSPGHSFTSLPLPSPSSKGAQQQNRSGGSNKAVTTAAGAVAASNNSMGSRKVSFSTRGGATYTDTDVESASFLESDSYHHSDSEAESSLAVGKRGGGGGSSSVPSSPKLEKAAKEKESGGTTRLYGPGGRVFDTALQLKGSEWDTRYRQPPTAAALPSSSDKQQQLQIESQPAQPPSLAIENAKEDASTAAFASPLVSGGANSTGALSAAVITVTAPSGAFGASPPTSGAGATTSARRGTISPPRTVAVLSTAPLRIPPPSTSSASESPRNAVAVSTAGKEGENSETSSPPSHGGPSKAVAVAVIADTTPAGAKSSLGKWTPRRYVSYAAGAASAPQPTTKTTKHKGGAGPTTTNYTAGDFIPSTGLATTSALLGGRLGGDGVYSYDALSALLRDSVPTSSPYNVNNMAAAQRKAVRDKKAPVYDLADAMAHAPERAQTRLTIEEAAKVMARRRAAKERKRAARREEKIALRKAEREAEYKALKATHGEEKADAIIRQRRRQQKRLLLGGGGGGGEGGFSDRSPSTVGTPLNAQPPNGGVNGFADPATVGSRKTSPPNAQPSAQQQRRLTIGGLSRRLSVGAGAAVGPLGSPLALAGAAAIGGWGSGSDVGDNKSSCDRSQDSDDMDDYDYVSSSEEEALFAQQQSVGEHPHAGRINAASFGGGGGGGGMFDTEVADSPKRRSRRPMAEAFLQQKRRRAHLAASSGPKKEAKNAARLEKMVGDPYYTPKGELAALAASRIRQQATVAPSSIAGNGVGNGVLVREPTESPADRGTAKGVAGNTTPRRLPPVATTPRPPPAGSPQGPSATSSSPQHRRRTTVTAVASCFSDGPLVVFSGPTGESAIADEFSRSSPAAFAPKSSGAPIRHREVSPVGTASSPAATNAGQLRKSGGEKVVGSLGPFVPQPPSGLLGAGGVSPTSIARRGVHSTKMTPHGHAASASAGTFLPSLSPLSSPSASAASPLLALRTASQHEALQRQQPLLLQRGGVGFGALAAAPPAAGGGGMATPRGGRGYPSASASPLSPASYSYLPHVAGVAPNSPRTPRGTGPAAAPFAAFGTGGAAFTAR